MVTFRDGAATIGVAAVGVDGAARASATLGEGTHTVSALYGGDAAFGPSLATMTHGAGPSRTSHLAAPPGRQGPGGSPR
ncbi:MAG: Ig-like domain-containing protein [Acidimicrobiia bacterium]